MGSDGADVTCDGREFQVERRIDGMISSSVLKGSHSFTCTPRVNLLTEWTIPAFAFPAEAGTHLPTPEGWKAELHGYILGMYQIQILVIRPEPDVAWYPTVYPAGTG